MKREEILLDRHRLLKAKRKEVRNELQRWAASHLNLAPDEKIEFLISIKKMKKLHNLPNKCAINGQLTEKDWEEILQLPLSLKQLAIINVFRRKDIFPLDVQEINSALGDFFEEDDLLCLNATFVANGSLYRFVDAKTIRNQAPGIYYARNWFEHIFMFYILK